MSINYAELAEEYYIQVGQKNVHEVEKYLHPDVELFGPLGEARGKVAVLETTKNFINVINSLKVRAKFGSGDQAMVVHESDIPGMQESFPGAVLLTFDNGLIIKIELFYDSKRVIEKKEEIFS